MRLSVEFMLEVVLVGGGLHWAHWKLYYLQFSGRGGGGGGRTRGLTGCTSSFYVAEQLHAQLMCAEVRDSARPFPCRPRHRGALVSTYAFTRPEVFHAEVWS